MSDVYGQRPAGDDGVRAVRMRCEYLKNPYGVDALKPRLNWAVQSAQRCQKQTAYQILVASDPEKLDRDEGDLWDTGKVESDQTIHIEYDGHPLTSGARCCWKVRIWDKDGKPTSWSDTATWCMGLLDRDDWKAQWIADADQARFTDRETADPAVMLRKPFEISGQVVRATAYATAAGVYELRINGRRVGDHLLAPEWTTYDKRIQYQTYDVTDMLTPGGNAVGAHLGEGWYCGPIGGDQFPGRHHYGAYPMLLVQIEIELADGSRQIIATDGTWRSTTRGPIRIGDIFNGEVYDARREMPGWDSGDFDDADWWPVHTEAVRDSVRLVCQPNEPMRIVKEVKPVGVTQPQPDFYIFDMGQNMAGWCRLTVHGDAGTSVSVRHGELVKSDGTLFTENLEGAKQHDRYILSGNGKEVCEPHFTYHGFRYVEVSGLNYRPKPEDLVGCVFRSASEETGCFESSSKLINQLMRNILWSQRGNMHGVPTDCPQRGERRGWQGDLQAFSQAASFNMDMSAFFIKCIRDMRDAQLPDGRYSNFTPRPKTFVYDDIKSRDTAGYGVPAWADAGSIVPWCAYRNYGDRRLLEEHFESAKRWSDYVYRQNPNFLWLNDRSRDYSDWLNSDEFDVYQHGVEPPVWGSVPKEVLATAFFGHSAEIVARMAKVLGKEEEAAQYAQRFEDIKAAFNHAFVDADGRIEKDTQAGYALALYFNMVDGATRDKVAKHLARTTRNDTRHLSTGIQSTHRAMLELTRNGDHKEACRLINLRSFPSWGYMIDHGATTIWERWDGFVEGRETQAITMNSYNHWAFGSVGEWVWRHLAGINPVDEQPAYKHFVIRPRPGRKIDWVRGSYDSIRGTIATDWELAGDRFTLKVTVPANTTATVYVPAEDAADVSESGGPAIEAEGVEFMTMEDGSAVFNVDSGSYVFDVR